MATTTTSPFDKFIEEQGAKPEVQKALFKKREIIDKANLATKSEMLDVVCKKWIETKAAFEEVILTEYECNLLLDEYEKHVTNEVKEEVNETVKKYLEAKSTKASPSSTQTDKPSP